MMIRSNLRWVVRSIFRCSFVVAHVPAPYVVVGVTTASNKCNRCRSEQDRDVSSSLSVPDAVLFLQEEVSPRTFFRFGLLLFCILILSGWISSHRASKSSIIF